MRNYLFFLCPTLQFCCVQVGAPPLNRPSCRGMLSISPFVALFAGAYDRSLHTSHCCRRGRCGLPDRIDCYFVWWGGWRNTDCTNVRDTEDSDER